MKRMMMSGLLALVLGTGLAWAKLPPPAPLNDEQKAAAEAKKAQDADAAKKDGEMLAKAQDRAVDNYKKNSKGGAKEAKPVAQKAAAKK